MAGGFFPREQLPQTAQAITEYMPLTAAVNLVRPLFLGAWPEHVLLNLSVLVMVAIISFVIALKLLRKRFEQ
jgi:lipooligosaccharide transport system permease protein